MNDMAQPRIATSIDRRTYIGGSDIAALVGVDPFEKTPLTVYLSKIGELAGIADPEKQLFLARRKRWEEPIVAMLREEFDGKIVAVNRRYVDPEHDFLAAEIDFEWEDADGSIQNGEIKTVSPFAFNESAGWGEPGTDQIPIYYHAQVMHGLARTKRRTCITAAMAGLDKMTFYRIERDEEAIAGLTDVAVDFWKNNVEARVPPAPTTMADITHLFAKRRGRPVELDEEAARALEQMRELRIQLKALEASEGEAALQVAQFIAAQWGQEAEEAIDNALLTHCGRELATWSAGHGSHLDQKRMKSEHPDLIAEYTVPHFYRTFRFKKSKG